MRNAAGKLSLAVACLVAAALAGGAARPAAGQERFRRTPPLPDPFRELKLPAIETAELSNGLVVAVTRRPGFPVVTIQMVVLAGEADSPPNLPSVATLTARMIGRRTKEYSADDLENMVESIGGDFSVSVSMDHTVLTFHAPAEYLDRALELLRLMILSPEFPELEVATAKRVVSYELRDLERDQEFLGRRQLLRVLFSGHPYGSSTFSWDVIRRVT
ncbi:MAG TPA: insulinase family protein, partial [Burkholderiales bacterium]|nr:insulinase family protein [Burkholderiales bacterium]